MNIEKSKNIYFRKKSSQKTSLRALKENLPRTNIIKDDRNIIKILRFGEIETVTNCSRLQILFMELSKFFRNVQREDQEHFIVESKGIKTPEPLGYIEVYDRFRLRQSYLFSKN